MADESDYDKVVKTSKKAFSDFRKVPAPIRGVLEEGFQIVVFPQIAAMKAFHAQTATGKLNAEITPIGPRGCHCSYIR